MAFEVPIKTMAKRPERNICSRPAPPETRSKRNSRKANVRDIERTEKEKQMRN